MTKLIMIFLLSAFVFIGARLYSGVYKDDEFSDCYWFVKHRADWQFKFEPVLYSGHEASDMDRLSIEDSEQHADYSEFRSQSLFAFYIPLDCR